ncbi:MAG: AAA family ATPase [Deltaproteobacteria bacterium]|nr:AAA family ATPase [Deltaproteobacteria bacterium]
MHIQSVTLFPEDYPTRECYPFSLATFQQTRRLLLDGPITFFVGENGTGKSTLLKAISSKCGIHIWQSEQGRRYELNPYEEELYRYIAVEWTNGYVPGSFFSSEMFRDFARYLDEWASADSRILDYFGGKSLITQSHGQSLMSFFKSRYKIKGLYLLDEPETALSPRSQLELLQVLEDMGGQGHAQFIIATHSPILMACPGARILSFDRVPVDDIAYKETSHYRIYKEFLDERHEEKGA